MTYHTYRKNYWKYQGGAETYDLVNFRGTKMQDGTPLDKPYLQPKKILFFKDIWHCPDLACAKSVAMNILKREDVTFLELKGTWVYVDWDHLQKDHILEGQRTDDRENIRKL